MYVNVLRIFILCNQMCQVYILQRINNHRTIKKTKSENSFSLFALSNVFLYAYCFLEHIDHVGKMSVSGYRDRPITPRLYQYVVSMSKTLNPPCFS